MITLGRTVHCVIYGQGNVPVKMAWLERNVLAVCRIILASTVATGVLLASVMNSTPAVLNVIMMVFVRACLV